MTNITSILKSIHTFLDSFSTPQHFVLALSAGIDSVVLAHAMHAMLQKNKITHMLSAIHVDHGLTPAAITFVNFCQIFCEQLKIPLTIRQIKIAAKKNIEEIARTLRYQAIRAELKADDIVLTAHHQNDQIETFLLQFARGAGVKGLSGIPCSQSFTPGKLVRPLLMVTRAEIEKYAEEHALKWIDDPTNASLNFDRNFCRKQVIPLLQQRWPQILATGARSVAWCQEAQKLINELAQLDHSRVRGITPGTLNIKQLQLLTIERLRNVLRYWIAMHQVKMPSDARLTSVMSTVITAKNDANPIVTWTNVEVRRYQNELFLIHKMPSCRHWHASWDLKSPCILPQHLGQVTAEKIMGTGLSMTKIAGKAVKIAFRHGGERCQPEQRTGSHPLKKLLQEWHVPPWQRDQIPLIFCDDQLIAVLGYCIDQHYAASTTEMGWQIHWQKGDS